MRNPTATPSTTAKIRLQRSYNCYLKKSRSETNQSPPHIKLSHEGSYHHISNCAVSPVPLFLIVYAVLPLLNLILKNKMPRLLYARFCSKWGRVPKYGRSLWYGIPWWTSAKSTTKDGCTRKHLNHAQTHMWCLRWCPVMMVLWPYKYREAWCAQVSVQCCSQFSQSATSR